MNENVKIMAGENENVKIMAGENENVKIMAADEWECQNHGWRGAATKQMLSGKGQK